MGKNSLLNLFDEAVQTYQAERKDLEFLPLSRYDQLKFPTIGQYDWLSGQLLYLLIRLVKPVRVIEVSTSSGYSGIFSALAVKRNGVGRLETFELLPNVAEAAKKSFNRAGVSDVVNIHVGNAHQTITEITEERKANPGREILFLDSEHTAEFARFYLDALLQDATDDSLFHMHDILPAGADVKYRPAELEEDIGVMTRYYFYRVLRRLALRKLPICSPRRLIHPVSFDVTLSTEARLGQKLSERIADEDQLFVYHVLNRYPQLEPHRYDTDCVWRCDQSGKPLEWNDSWWSYCGALKKAYSTGNA